MHYDSKSTLRFFAFSLPAKITQTLPSVIQIKKFLHEELLPQVQAGGKTINVVCQNKAWGMPSCSGILEIKGGHERNA